MARAKVDAPWSATLRAYAFVPGHKAGKGLPVMAMAMVLRRMERGHLTVHGFRSTFLDWCAESTSFGRETAGAALV